VADQYGGEDSCEAVPKELRFWVFVDLRKNPAEPAVYYIAPSGGFRTTSTRLA
jgi:hypothetical protein